MKMTSSKLLVLFAVLEACLTDVRQAFTSVRALNDKHDSGQMSLYGLDVLLHELLDARDDPTNVPVWISDACTDSFALRAAVKQRIIAQLQPRFTMRLGTIRANRNRRIDAMIESSPGIRALRDSLFPSELPALLRPRAA